MWHSMSRRSWLIATLTLIALLAFGMRMIGLAEVPPRWDEGWSVAMASLSLPEIFTITSADVHPPLYYMLLGAWQNLVGVNLFAARYLAVLMSLPTIPLAFAVARVWSRASHTRNSSLRPALLAALLMAWLPLAVYYSAVIRMYALAPTLVLLAAWAALQMTTRPMDALKGRQVTQYTLAFVVGTTGAMLTLYHSVWALAALSLYALILIVARMQHELLRRLQVFFTAVILSMIAYLPWAIYAVPQFLQRAAGGGSNVGQQLPLGYYLRLGIEDLTMPQMTGQAGPAFIGILIGAGLVCALIRKPCSIYPAWLDILLPVLITVITLFGVAVAARNWAFNARMLICAAPSLALLLAWAFDQMATRSQALAAIAGIGLFGLYFTTSTSFVYQKTLEVFDPYNPHTYLQHIASQGRSGDVVFFNVLSPAGFYALDRTSTNPGWSYALSWDPVIEPYTRWQERITATTATHPRLWVVLYRGLAGKNGDLRGWLDTHLYPANAQWGEEDVFYGLYGNDHLRPKVAGKAAGTHWLAENGFDLELRASQLAASVPAGDIIPIKLTWQAHAPLNDSYKVFVHAFDESGDLVTQHDALPVNDLRPMPSFTVGMDVEDNHGLALPATFHGLLRIDVGVYDPVSGARLRTPSGQDSVSIGTVDVTGDSR